MDFLRCPNCRAMKYFNHHGECTTCGYISKVRRSINALYGEKSPKTTLKYTTQNTHKFEPKKSSNDDIISTSASFSASGSFLVTDLSGDDS